MFSIEIKKKKWKENLKKNVLTTCVNSYSSNCRARVGEKRLHAVNFFALPLIWTAGGWKFNIERTKERNTDLRNARCKFLIAKILGFQVGHVLGILIPN